MSALCGFAGPGAPGVVEAMLAAISGRGERQEIASVPGCTLGFRTTGPNAIARDERSLLACAGTLAPGATSPAETLRERWPLDFAELDGAFALAHWSLQTRTLSLCRDPFGVRALYYVSHADTLYFASELRALLAIPQLPLTLDPTAIHKYLTFSFVPGEAMPFAGIKRLPPGQLLTSCDGKLDITRYFTLEERLDPRFEEQDRAVRVVRRVAQRATRRRLFDTQRVALFLSGGLDSASVAVWLKHAGAEVHAFSLDFGEHSVERDQAREAASALEIRQHWVPVTAQAIADAFERAADHLELPFGDPVTVPQFMLGRAAHEAGFDTVFNGEGGDQLFGGWTNKPMIAAEVYAGMYEQEPASRAEMYLQSYHRFYGSEDELYTPDFKTRIGPRGQRRALLQPYLADDDHSFLSRLRTADIALKGSDNILPRAEAMASAWGLRLEVPLFDRKLATLAFRLPPQLKLHGACEKFVLKLAMQKFLPSENVWRRKFGMSVPITDYVLSPAFTALREELLGERAVRARGFFRPQFIADLCSGRDLPNETRRRRVGERIWVLMMLEAWMRRYVDRSVR